MAIDDGDADDPFEGLSLDDEFIRSAKVREDSAEARVARLRRIDQQHRDLEAERDVERSRAARAEVRRVRKALAPTDGTVPAASAASSRHTWRVVIVLVVLFGLFVYASYVRQGGAGGRGALGVGGQGLLGGADASSGEVLIQGGQPPAGVDEAKVPIGRPAAHATGAGPYAFIALQADEKTPVAYDPCRPIHYVVNPRTAPANGGALLADAVGRISSATGLSFIYDGPTNETPSEDRASFQPDRYGQRWAPVLVAWTDPREIPGLDGLTTGLGGSARYTLPGGAVYLTGGVSIDGPQMAEIEAGPGGAAEARAVIQHELGHLVGLQHVDDPSQIMNPTGSAAVTDYAGGDLEGLALLGQGACFPKI